MKPHTACPAGQADAVKSTPSRPMHSATRVHVRSRVGAVRWRPSLHHVDTWMPPCPAHHPDASVWTTPSSRALHVAPIAVVPLRHASGRSLYLRTEPSPPFLSPGAAHVTPTQCTTIKGGHPVASHPCQRLCLPPVSRHHRARLYFPPRRWCRATSPLLSPRAQVQELH
jgi:hypothetical protein